MQRLFFASLVAVLLALPGCELLESAPSATVTVKQDGAAPACCPMEGAGTAADKVAGDGSECSESAAKSDCAPSECDTAAECDKVTDCEIQCEESPCEIDGDTNQ